MNLVACDAPNGALDEAPRTALRQDTLTEQWDGFWAGDDRYYARCTAAGGGVRWFTLEDSGTELTAVDAALYAPLAALPNISATSAAVRRTIRHTVIFRVGRSASHRCIVGVRRSLKRSIDTRLAERRSRARSSDFSA